MPKFGIVILNYVAWGESIDCVASIERCHIDYEYLVIVDNASPNQSFNVLQKEYKDKDRICVIQTPKNEGFARGNNYGIQFLRKKGIDFVLLLNSDTVIQDEMYMKKMLCEYKKGVGVIGSKIKLAYGREQGMEYRDLSLGAILFDLVSSFCRIHYLYFPYRVSFEKEKNIWLRGCSLLLTPDFFKKYKYLWPYTFLYREELVLSIMLEKAKLSFAMTDAYIYHKGGQSTGIFFTRRSLKREKLELHGCFQELIVRMLPYSIIKRVM